MKNIAKNQRVIQSLPNLISQGYKHAYLVAESDSNVPVVTAIKSGSPIFEFLYNPESINISTPISYQETAVPFTSVPQVSYVGGGSRTMTISDIYLDTHIDKKSLQPILDKLTTMREPTIKNGVLLSPPYLYFKWGESTSFPCVLTQIDYQITNWINGYPTRAKLTLSLKEVPTKNKRVANNPVTKPVTKTNNLPKPLTPKQIEDGKKNVTDFLLPDIKKAFPKKSTNKVKLNLDSHTGEIKLQYQDGSELFPGKYNGDKLLINLPSFKLGL